MGFLIFYSTFDVEVFIAMSTLSVSIAAKILTDIAQLTR